VTIKLRRKFKKIRFYIRGGLRYATPDVFFRRRLPGILRTIDRYDRAELVDRVNYYLKEDQPIELSDDAITRRELPFKHSFYFFDLQDILCYFPSSFRFNFIFGDVNYTPPVHSFVKSRPVGDSNRQGVLLKLNRVRHYPRIEDSLAFRDKKDMAVWRGVPNHPRRVEFLERFHNHPLCDVGFAGQNIDATIAHLTTSRMDISQQLTYKFALSIEGNDVATNLKWITQSNSLCLMTKPRNETWFMEGRLIPSVHYVEIKNDYSDLEEKIEHYISRPDEAEAIIENAKQYVANFFNTPKERLLSVLVAMKYFQLTGQYEGESPLDE